MHLHVHTNNAAGIILTGMQVVRHVEGVEEETEKVEAKAMVEGEDSIWEGPGFAAEL